MCTHILSMCAIRFLLLFTMKSNFLLLTKTLNIVIVNVYRDVNIFELSIFVVMKMLNFNVINIFIVNKFYWELEFDFM